MSPTVSELGIDSPIGPLTLVSAQGVLTEIRFAASSARDSDEVLSATATQLNEYFAGARKDFDVPLGAQGTDFQQEVWKELGAVAFGETASYGAIANSMGRPKAVRAVGAANGQNPIPIIVPCHRIIGSDGSLTGYAGGLKIKKWLLAHESPQATLL